jgi:hypothetical protein
MARAQYPRCVFFEPQTGLIRKREPRRSNFYNFAIPNDPKTIRFVEETTDKAAERAMKSGAGDLTYPRSFLQWLTKAEKRCR